MSMTITQMLEQVSSLASLPSPGRVLGRGSLSALSLPSSVEGGIAIRLAVRGMYALEDSLQSLIQQLADAGFPQELQDQVDTWIRDFVSLEDEEKRSFALAVLIIRIIRPEILNGNAALFALEDDCVDILSHMLPDVDAFIADCEEGLCVDAEVYQALSERIEFAAAAELRAILDVTDRGDERVMEAIRRFQTGAEAALESNDERRSAINRAVERVYERVLSHQTQMTSMAEIVEGMEADQSFHTTLRSCTNLLERLRG